MDFGKLTDITNVNFALPPDDANNQRVLAKSRRKTGENVGENAREKVRIYVGCTGWAMKEWVGKTYPKGAKSNEFLKYYGLQFNTIELNTTHYRTPSISTIREWASAVPPDFRFCPKLLQSVSHSPDLGINQLETATFLEAISFFQYKLGNCFMQLPPSFKLTHLTILEQFLKKFRYRLLYNLPFSIEIRHESWFKEPQHRDIFFQLLEHFHISTVITDVAGRRDVLHQRLTTPTALIRFVGNATPTALHETDKMRIDEWVNRIKIWIDAGLEELYFFTHQPDNLLAPELADYTCKKMETILGKNNIILRGVNFFDTPPPQMTLF